MITIGVEASQAHHVNRQALDNGQQGYQRRGIQNQDNGYSSQILLHMKVTYLVFHAITVVS